MLFWSIALLAFLADAGIKWVSASALAERTVSLGGLAVFYITHNTGMALGFLADNIAAGILLPLTAIFCGWLMMRRYRITRFTAIACGLVMGGFAGNFLERLWHGYVLDMIYFPWLPWFVCNAADIFICFGVALLAYSLLLRPADWQEKEVTKDAEN